MAIGHFPVENNETMELVIKELKKAFPDFDKIVFTHLEEEEEEVGKALTSGLDCTTASPNLMEVWSHTMFHTKL